MKKKSIFKILIFSSTAFIALFLIITMIYGWYINADQVGSVKLQITKINSEIYLYKGIDSNYNGIPDLISDYTSTELATIQTKQDVYPVNKHYYQENKVFSYIDKEAALSTEPTGNVKLQMNMDKVYPTQIKTFKFAVINNSDAENFITFSFNEKTYSADDLKLLSTMSFRIGKVINTSSPYSITSTSTRVEFTDKFYFGNYITTTGTIKSNEFVAIGDDDAYEINGALKVVNNDNCLDFWVQFEMEAYDTLTTNINDYSSYLTSSAYQTLQGKTIDFPLLKLALELRIDD